MSEPVDTASPIFQVNRQKIPKWVFMLLKQHHERLGLKVSAWSGPEGIGTPRLSFYFDRVRMDDGTPQYFFDLAEDAKSVDMQIYQATVGVFAPLRGESSGGIYRRHDVPCRVDVANPGYPGCVTL